jgi:hypothetical protein
MANQYRVLPKEGGNPRQISEVVNNAMEGKINSTGEFTLDTGGATSTVIYDRRIGPDSVILFMPTSLSSAAANKYPYGLFEYDSNYTFAAADTPYVLPLNSSEHAFGASLSSNQITVDYAGLYDVFASVDFTNSGAQKYDVYVWFRVNGVNVPHTTVHIGVTDKQGAVQGATRLFTDHPLDLSASDYVEIVAAVSNTAVSIVGLSSQTTPYVRPSAPAITIEVNLLQPSQTADSAFEPYVSARDKGQATVSHLPNSVAGKTYSYLVIG